MVQGPSTQNSSLLLDLLLWSHPLSRETTIDKTAISPFFFFFCQIFNIFLNWSMVDSQCYVNICCTAKWFSYTCMYIFCFKILFSIELKWGGYVCSGIWRTSIRIPDMFVLSEEVPRKMRIKNSGWKKSNQ